MGALKISRPLSILLCFIVLISSFTVSVYGADEENLIESDLRDWDAVEDSTGIAITEYNGAFLLSSSSAASGYDSYVKSTLVYDLSELIAGNSYTFSFEILDLFEAQSFNPGLTWENYYGGPASRSGTYTFGLASYDYGLDRVEIIDNIFINVNSSNYASMYGTSHTLTFDMPNVVNPCIIIYYVEYSDNYENQNIMLRNLSLVDNTKANTDSFLERIFNWFEVKFNNLSSSFTDLGDRLKGFFSDLSSNISDGLSDVRDGITTKFAEFEGWLSALGDRISGFFTDLGSSISNGLSDVRDKINNKIAEVSEKFTDFFEKFKPRVHLNLDWSRGTFNGNGEVIQENNSNLPVIIVSELFEVPSGSSYYVSYKKFDSNLVPGAGILQYDLSGNFLGVLYSTNASFEEYELPSGYMYRFRQSWTRGIEVDDDIANQHFSLYCDSGWLNALLFNISSTFDSFFTKLGNLILYASWTDVPPENPFLLKESPMSSLTEKLDNISSAFDSAGESFENVIDSITGPVYLLDEFTKEFGWVLGILVFTLLVIVISRFIGL